MRIQPVVEGHGEVAAVPELLRRLLVEARTTGVDVGRPIRRTRSQLATEEGLARSIALARSQSNCAAILVLFDGDNDCPAHLGPAAQGWANAAARGLPCAVCIAHREYESWFLATLDSLRHKAIKADAQAHPQPEVPETPRARCHVGCSAEATSRRRTSPRSAPCSASRMPTGVPDPSASWPPPSASCWRPWRSPPPSGRLRHGAPNTLESGEGRA